MERHPTFQQREAPLNRTGPIPPRPTTKQLCPYMMAARLMTLLWPGPDTPTQNYPDIMEVDMPGIQRCFFGTPHKVWTHNLFPSHAHAGFHPLSPWHPLAPAALPEASSAQVALWAAVPPRVCALCHLLD